MSGSDDLNTMKRLCEMKAKNLQKRRAQRGATYLMLAAISRSQCACCGSGQ